MNSWALGLSAILFMALGAFLMEEEVSILRVVITALTLLALAVMLSIVGVCK